MPLLEQASAKAPVKVAVGSLQGRENRAPDEPFVHPCFTSFGLYDCPESSTGKYTHTCKLPKGHLGDHRCACGAEQEQAPNAKCPLCRAELGPGDVPFGSELVMAVTKSEAQRHLAQCMGRNATGPMRDALSLLVTFDDQFEELFGHVDGADQAKRHDIDDIARMFRGQVEEFFRGKDYFGYVGEAHIWVARHDGFSTLVIEPEGTGGSRQFEVAVRFDGAENRVMYDNHKGLIPGYLCSTSRLIGYGVDH